MEVRQLPYAFGLSVSTEGKPLEIALNQFVLRGLGISVSCPVTYEHVLGEGQGTVWNLSHVSWRILVIPGTVWRRVFT